MTSRESAQQSDHSVRHVRVVRAQPFPIQEYCKLLIRRTKNDRPIYLTALKNTASFYGWLDNFEEYLPGVSVDKMTGKSYLSNPCLANSRRNGGRQWIICRDNSRHGFPMGKTNKFRVTTLATLRDIAEIAYRTQVHWEWMRCPSGVSRSREQWLHIHQAYLQ